jgi:hypothetical protein
MKNLPIAIFANNTPPNTTLIDLAQEIITKTREIFRNGSSNRYQDLINNPNAYYEISNCWDHKISFKIPPTEELQKLSKLSKKEFMELWDIISRIARSYKFKIGNCADLSAVGLHFACSNGADLLLSAATVHIKYIDHVFLKLESKDNGVIYVDPWFLTSENSGAIVDAESFELYFKALLPSLYLNFYIQFLGCIYPARYAIAIGLLALAIHDQDPWPPALCTLFGMSLLPLSMLPVAAAYYCSRPEINALFTIHNSNESSNTSFQVFDKLCKLYVENTQPPPVIFSPKASHLPKNNSNISLPILSATPRQDKTRHRSNTI